MLISTTEGSNVDLKKKKKLFYPVLLFFGSE